MASPLTAGFCERATSTEDVSECFDSVVQVLNVKKIASTDTTAVDRYRAILSDGQYFIQAMLATQLNHFVESKQVDKHSLVKVVNFSVNSVSGRKLLIILALEVVPWTDEKIGNPVSVDQAKGGASASAQPGGAHSASLQSTTTAPAPGRAQVPARNAPSARPGNTKHKGDLGPLYPIEGLSPYQNRWTIKARVTQKSDIRHYSNQRGDGKLFNVTFMDETGEIRATGFNDAVDNFYNLLEVGKVFFVSRARINIAKKQFSNVNNEYEIMFERDTEIEPCADESVPQVKYNFKGIGDLGELQKDDVCDVIGVVREVGELGSVTSRATNKPFAKRELQLVDQSGQSVRLTLWGKQAETFQADDQPVIAFKGVKVGDFGGRSLSMFSNATMTINPDIPEAHSLRGWFDAEGHSKHFAAYTTASVGDSAINTATSAAARPAELKTIAQVKDEQLGMSEKTDFFSTEATVAFIKKDPFSYPACANPDNCAKKVVEDGSGWWCEKCQRRWDEPIHRYILSMNVMDYTGQFWMTAFNETAEQIMGISANDLMKLKNEGNDLDYDAHFAKATARTYVFQMMAKQDSFNDQVRVRYQCRKVAPPDYVADSAHLSQMISEMSV
ncbi:replication factor A1 [Cryptococcus neoformans c8]|nr:replication factor A1 [Cryptococcus neoformans var. grubii AD1-83a]OXG60718.1 replication factor A1 [Cryptococcus neoformans var. grubii MW-RSA1955]OXG64205.1 replication factor A1 [Cryptococcus neoformans var. grubii c8]OXG65603.1 replication factor A1 [Cryptococcus neoformans var. grubii CHC193]OXH12016.1 replication factor A1 [Cryptococcus neoformans var. grubii A5-35-17]OXH13188.1 replication factor A1 [Cryptococcus neoformans var. grubii A1-35-8]